MYLETNFLFIKIIFSIWALTVQKVLWFLLRPAIRLPIWFYETQIHGATTNNLFAGYLQ